MKKFLFLILIAGSLLAASSSYGQAGYYALATPNALGLDTVTNAAAKAGVIKISGYMKTVAVQVTVTKISGTVGGSAALQGSLDGVTYYNVTGATALTLTDVASQGQIWSLVDPGYQYYRVLVTGTGTMSVSFSDSAISRRLTQ